jgi:hypothetical protein
VAERVMLVGRRRGVLEPTAARLVARGYEVRWSTRAGRALVQVGPFAPDVLALGRGVGADDRATLVAAFQARVADLRVVDGLAPIPELLVAQVQQAAHPPQGLGDVSVAGDELRLDLAEPGHVTVVEHQLGLTMRARRRVVADVDLPAGPGTVPLPKGTTGRGRRFLVVSSGDDVAVLPHPS